MRKSDRRGIQMRKSMRRQERNTDEEINEKTGEEY